MDTFLVIYILNFLIVKFNNSGLDYLSFLFSEPIDHRFPFSQDNGINTNFILFMFIKVKLTFKPINLVKIKLILLIFNNMEKYLLAMETFIKLFIFIIYL